MSICKEAIFKQVFDSWCSKLQLYLIARGQSKSAAADICQETFLKLWQNCNKVSLDALPAYLYTLAKRLQIDNYRKEKVALKYKTNQISDKVTLVDGQYELETKAFKDKIEQAIESMPATAREVFVMRKFSDQSNKEVAEALEISIKAVEKRMSIALKHMYEQKIFKKR